MHRFRSCLVKKSTNPKKKRNPLLLAGKFAARILLSKVELNDGIKRKVAYATGANANNLKTRFRTKLKPVDVSEEKPFYGFRWLAPLRGELILWGELKRKSGNKPHPLFTLVGELLPRTSWSELPEHLSGVYVLFDASETARYVGIAKDMRERLGTYFQGSNDVDQEKREVITAFSVYAVSTRQRARELESLLIHVLGPQLFLNRQKHRHFGVRPNYNVFEPGTLLLRRRTRYVGVEAFREGIQNVE